MNIMNGETIDWDNLDLSGTSYSPAGTSPLASAQQPAPAKVPEAPSSFSNSLNMGPTLASSPAAGTIPSNDAFNNAPKWAQAGISGNWSGLLSERPDVASEYQQESTRDSKSKAYLQQIGATSPENYAKWWWDQWGGEYSNAKAPITSPAVAPPTTPVGDWAATPAPAPTAPAAPAGPSAAQIAAEQSRINALLSTYSPAAYQARTNANTAGIYDDNYLMGLQDEIDQILEQMGREQPQYGQTLNFDPYKEILNTARQTVGSKRASYAAGIQKELADITAGRTRLNDIQAWDEDGLNYVASLLDRESADIGRYTGNTDPARNALDEAMRLIDERRYGLSTGRSAIEADALTALTGLETASVDKPTLDQLFSTYGSLKGRSQQWKSTQSNDELEQLYTALTGHKTRLATDAKNVADRQAAEAARVTKDSRGNSRFASALLASREGVMSEAQYRAYRSRLKDPAQQSYPSSFATNLGI